MRESTSEFPQQLLNFPHIHNIKAMRDKKKVAQPDLITNMTLVDAIYRCVDWFSVEARFESGKMDLWKTNARIEAALATRLFSITHNYLEDAMNEEIRDINWKSIEVVLGFRSTSKVKKKKSDGTEYELEVAGPWKDFDPTADKDQKRYQKKMSEYLQTAAATRYEKLPEIASVAATGATANPAFVAEAARVLPGVFKSLKEAGYSLPSVSDLTMGYIMSGKGKVIASKEELRKQLTAFLKDSDAYTLVDKKGNTFDGRTGPNPFVKQNK